MTDEPKVDITPAQGSLEQVKAALRVSDAIGFQMAMADTIQNVSLRVGVLARELRNEDERLGTDNYGRLSQRMKQAEGLLNNVVRELDDMRKDLQS